MAIISDDLYSSAFIFAGVFFMAYVYFTRTKATPGQLLAPRLRTLPIIGSLPFMPHIDKMHVWFLDQLSTLGSVIGFYSRDRYAVVLQTREAVHEAFVEKSATFSGRPPFYINSLLNPRRLGIVERPTDAAFKKDHLLILSIMKQFGFGKLNVMELRINEEVDDLLVELDCPDARSAAGIYPLRAITSSTVNIIASIMFGSRFKRSDPELEKLMTFIGDFFREAIHVMPVNLFPILRFLPRIRRQIGWLIRTHGEFMDYIGSKVDAVVATMTSEAPRNDDKPDAVASFVRSFVDMDGGPTKYNRESLIFILRDLLMAGFETTASAINWAVVILAENQDVQRKMQAEIDSIAGADKKSRPSLADRPRLPYVEATILELMRYKTIAPMSVARETSNKSTVDGYEIPAGTTVMPNLYALHMDKNVWSNPDKFRPERFIDGTGDVDLKARVIPFSLGKRSCLGESLARQEIFLFVTGLMHSYSVLPPEGCEHVDYQERVSVTLTPSPYKVRFVPRRQ